MYYRISNNIFIVSSTNRSPELLIDMVIENDYFSLGLLNEYKVPVLMFPNREIVLFFIYWLTVCFDPFLF